MEGKSTVVVLSVTRGLVFSPRRLKSEGQMTAFAKLCLQENLGPAFADCGIIVKAASFLGQYSKTPVKLKIDLVSKNEIKTNIDLVRFDSLPPRISRGRIGPIGIDCTQENLDHYARTHCPFAKLTVRFVTKNGQKTIFPFEFADFEVPTDKLHDLQAGPAMQLGSTLKVQIRTGRDTCCSICLDKGHTRRECKTPQKVVCAVCKGEHLKGACTLEEGKRACLYCQSTRHISVHCLVFTGKWTDARLPKPARERQASLDESSQRERKGDEKEQKGKPAFAAPAAASSSSSKAESAAQLHTKIAAMVQKEVALAMKLQSKEIDAKLKQFDDKLDTLSTATAKAAQDMKNDLRSMFNEFSASINANVAARIAEVSAGERKSQPSPPKLSAGLTMKQQLVASVSTPAAGAGAGSSSSSSARAKKEAPGTRSKSALREQPKQS
jgi:hypothetical protein